MISWTRADLCTLFSSSLQNKMCSKSKVYARKNPHSDIHYMLVRAKKERMFENIITLTLTTLSWWQLLHPPLPPVLLLLHCTVVVVSVCFLCVSWILCCISGPACLTCPPVTLVEFYHRCYSADRTTCLLNFSTSISFPSVVYPDLGSLPLTARLTSVYV